MAAIAAIIGPFTFRFSRQGLSRVFALVRLRIGSRRGLSHVFALVRLRIGSRRGLSTVLPVVCLISEIKQNNYIEDPWL